MPRSSFACALAASLLVAAAPGRASEPGARPCVALADPAPLRAGGALRGDDRPPPPTDDRPQPPGPGDRPARSGPVTPEEVTLVLRDLQRVPLEGGGFTLRGARRPNLAPERLREVVGDLRAVLAVQHGREAIAALRGAPGEPPPGLEAFERGVAEIARCTFERLGGEAAFRQALDAVGDRRAALEAVVLQPFPPARERP
jgi:hypothetical protein